MRPLDPRKDPYRVEFYEGLARKTAGKYVHVVDEEYEDLCQILRFKAWRALESFRPEKSNVPVERYVFSCIRNQVKDLLKKRKRDELHIEDIAPGDRREALSHGGVAPRDAWEGQYMRCDEDVAFAEILDETPLIPSTLTATERKVLVYLYLEYQQRDISTALKISMREVARSVKAIKTKMADWKPDGDRLNGKPMTTLEGGPTVEQDQEQGQERVP